MNPEKPYISIAGIIGAGKTTLAEALGKTLGLQVYRENVENKVLSDFYEDMKKYSFELQMLCEKGLLEQRAHQTYVKMFHMLAKFMYGCLTLHLKFEEKTDLDRIFGRFSCDEFEKDTRKKNITLEYLEELHGAYDSFMEGVSEAIPVIKVDWENSLEEQDVEGIACKIREKLKQIQTIHFLY